MTINNNLTLIKEKLPELFNVIENNLENLENYFVSFRRIKNVDFINPVNDHITPSGYYSYPLNYFIEHFDKLTYCNENEYFFVYHNNPLYFHLTKIDKNKILTSENENIIDYFYEFLNYFINQYKNDKLNKHQIDYLTLNNQFDFNDIIEFIKFNNIEMINYLFDNYSKYQNDIYKKIYKNLFPEYYENDWNNYESKFYINNLSKLYKIILDISILEKYKDSLKLSNIINVNNIKDYSFTYVQTKIFKILNINGILTNPQEDFIAEAQHLSGQLLLFNQLPILEQKWILFNKTIRINFYNYEFNDNDNNIKEYLKFIYHLINTFQIEKVNYYIIRVYELIITNKIEYSNKDNLGYLYLILSSLINLNYDENSMTITDSIMTLIENEESIIDYKFLNENEFTKIKENVI